MKFEQRHLSLCASAPSAPAQTESRRPNIAFCKPIEALRAQVLSQVRSPRPSFPDICRSARMHSRAAQTARSASQTSGGTHVRKCFFERLRIALSEELTALQNYAPKCRARLIRHCLFFRRACRGSFQAGYNYSGEISAHQRCATFGVFCGCSAFSQARPREEPRKSSISDA